ncbi:enhanced intracellular survival protein Eis [Paenibacillaceae bacterium WGS1546]|uniref:GNAT family N-acetyltransferase n=1 Tax=Cohnella sp. WGS1546 TaxID=3366810 RepID=UPI00372D7952
MEIRQLTTQDYDERMALSQFAFQMRWTEEQLEKRRGTFRPEWDWGAFDEQGTMLSALTLIPFEAWVHGRKLAMGGVAGVATWPEARRQGCVSKLLSHALETMKKDGQTISMLHPFSFAFYRKFGYEMTVEHKKYELGVRQLPPRTDVLGTVRRMADPDIGLLNGIYSAYASRYNGNLERTPEWWKERVLRNDGTAAVYESESGAPEGYVFYDVQNRALAVHEFVALNETAREALWSYVANHDSMIDRVTLQAPIDDGLTYLLADPRIKQEVVPYFMSRIVDAEAFVKLYAWSPGADGESVLLELKDEHAPWNAGSYRLAWDADGAGVLTKLEGAEAEASAGKGLVCSIQELSAMLLGDRKPAWLAAVGRLSGPEESVRLLERRIPTRTPYLMDFF